ncbi:MAG TPA: thioredoxin family protein, partial [Longimicrobiales bacterium]|nr:thioredoxin family protein [Longimicrobiales bacterium]
MRPKTVTRTLLTLALLTVACGGEPPPSDPSVVWAEAETWVPGEAGLLGDDWAYATEESDSLPRELVERVRAAVGAIDGAVRMLAVTRDACIDSAHTIPYLAALADAIPALEFRVAHPRVGGALMEAHRTPDGRAATPTVVFLDENGE